ncbi:MAG: histone deacetylase [Deltaproteobacteria bacterium]|nr:histone deacetylase [Deltaproteobacteria bacterium]
MPVSVSIVRDPRFRAHRPGPHHPETPLRLASVDQAIDRALEEQEFVCEEIEPASASLDDLERVHDPAYVRRVLSTEGRPHVFDPDTITSEGSIEAARLAAGSTIELARRVADGRSPPGLALVRPPGHHATRDRAMGFCLFNNIAVAARHLIDTGRAERIAIYDWDIHHGNGTQDIFFEDDRVLYMSTHQAAPFYPGTGAAHETGRGRGAGTTVNVPLPAGTDDDTLLAVTRTVLSSKVRSFRPDMILISAGFDAYTDDPIGQFRISVEGFGTLASMWRDLAESIANGRIAAVLEGGYHLGGLGQCVRQMLKSWAGLA